MNKIKKHTKELKMQMHLELLLFPPVLFPSPAVTVETHLMPIYDDGYLSYGHCGSHKDSLHRLISKS